MKRLWNRRPALGGHLLFVGLLFALALGATWTRPAQQLERGGLALAMHWLPDIPLGERVLVLAIDERALEAYGPWPWPRDRLGRAIRKLDDAGVAAIGLVLPMDQSQTPPALADILDEIRDGRQKIERRLAALKADLRSKKKTVRKRAQKKRDRLLAGRDKLDTASYWLGRLDSDRKLARVLKQSRHTVIPAFYERSLSPQPLPETLTRFALEPVQPQQQPWYLSPWLAPLATAPGPYQHLRLTPPYAPLLKAAGAVGALPASQRDDLRVGNALALEFGDRVYPSLPLLLRALGSGHAPGDIEPLPGMGIRIGKVLIPTDRHYIHYPLPMHLREGNAPIPVLSLADLLGGRIPAERLKDRVVLIGHTTGLTGLQGTILADVPPVLLQAWNTATLFEQAGIAVPGWFHLLQRGLLLAIALYFLFLPARLQGRPVGLVISLILALLLLNSAIAVLLAGHLWLPAVLPALFLVLGQLLLAGRYHIVVAIEESRQEAAEAHRTLGINYHNQGLYDQAFIEFKRCPADLYVLDPLYQLGLEYERKRQFVKAIGVYEYMREIDPDYRDIQARIARLNTGTESAVATMIAQEQKPEETLVLDQTGIEKPRLGRYIIEAQLGKGAMGTVYLGRDEKIGRQVAIKTLPFNQEFEGHDLEEVKWRFFREAEASGRLDHNNIVHIYDVGEEHDLAYIAMDFVPGYSMDHYAREGALLDPLEITRIMQQIARALAYAHRKQVVHRDIKPANIIYDRDSGTLKITDFGIASLVDDSKTRTGTLLGTPSYMSPEQVAGEKVDGRSDLYSLGVTLYQLLTGELPFVGDSLANLMYLITNAEPKDIRELRKGLTKCLSEVVQKAMAKKPEDRFQSGDEMAEALRRCELELQRRRKRAQNPKD